MKALPLVLALLVPSISFGWECREGLEEYKTIDGKEWVFDAAPEKHWEEASDVLFGRVTGASSRQTELGRTQFFVHFQVVAALKGDLQGTVDIRIDPEGDFYVPFAQSHVLTLFDGGELDPCSKVFPMPYTIDTLDELLRHAQRDDYYKRVTAEYLRELLRIAQISP